jgi:hypothetical protein
MTIQIGAMIRGIVQRDHGYLDQGTPPQPATLYIRDVTFELVGSPIVPGPTFTIAVTDATQWDTLQVGQTCTIAIYPP